MNEDPLSEATARQVLDRFGLSTVGRDLEGLEVLYRAWCENVPFDNSRKLPALERGDETLPGGTAEDFFDHWLGRGTGGTCWPSSNALFALVRHCGFEARRISGSMMDAGVPNHGSVVARIDSREYLVDSSILSYRPLLLSTPDTWNSEVELYPVRVEHAERGSLIFFPGFRGDSMPCRLLEDPVSHRFYLERYEASREQSVFNNSICARRHFADRIVGLLGDSRLEVSAQGVKRAKLRRREVEHTLRHEIGLADEVISALPDSAFRPWQN